MNSFKLLLLTGCCLLIAQLSIAQESSRDRGINVSELRDSVDQKKVDLYLKAVTKEIEELIDDYPQLSSWKLWREGKTWSQQGTTRTSTSLTYAHGLKEPMSSNYLDWFGTEGFNLEVRIVSQRYFSRLSGGGIGTVVFGSSAADGCVIANVMSANPKVPELEKKITDIIRTFVTSLAINQLLTF